MKNNCVNCIFKNITQIRCSPVVDVEKLKNKDTYQLSTNEVNLNFVHQSFKFYGNSKIEYNYFD